jgi:hypothetical protein
MQCPDIPAAPLPDAHRLRVRLTGTKSGVTEARTYSGWTRSTLPS